MDSLTELFLSKGLQSPAQATEELVGAAEQIARICLASKPRLRPSAIARELRALSKSLGRAAQAAERLGEDGMLQLFAASGANRELDDLDPLRHVEYLTRLAKWSARAAATATELSVSAQDQKGGRTPDTNLRTLVVLLMERFQEILSIRPTHVVNPDTGLGESAFDLFVKNTIRLYAPAEMYIEPRRIDEAVRWALDSRDLEFFSPPPFPDE